MSFGCVNRERERSLGRGKRFWNMNFGGEWWEKRSLGLFLIFIYLKNI